MLLVPESSAAAAIPEVSHEEPLSLAKHFLPFRRAIVGIDTEIPTVHGIKPLVYVDWTASGRAFRPLEELLLNKILPIYGNSHSPGSLVGASMTEGYEEARRIVMKHVNADEHDVVVFKGSGMTAAVNWFQRMMGLKEDTQRWNKRLVVFVTHMEHHSNQTSWLETCAEVVVLKAGADGLPSLENLDARCREFRQQGRPLIGAFTACSNVTGIVTDYHAMARVMHEHGGLCVVDFAASAPYVSIDMHPKDPLGKLDAIFFSPHKFLGGPGSAGVAVFDSRLYRGGTPVDVGGGTVKWTNPWGEHSFVDEIGEREDAGTPGLLQAMRTALAIKVKDAMEVAKIQLQKQELVDHVLLELSQTPHVQVLAADARARQGIISFTVDHLHYGLVVKLLNDRFGIQARGGCSCAGTYGHHLFEIEQSRSKQITSAIESGDNSQKPGWVRISLHPTMTKPELEYVLSAIRAIMEQGSIWAADYSYNPRSNVWSHCLAPAVSNAEDLLRLESLG